MTTQIPYFPLTLGIDLAQSTSGQAKNLQVSHYPEYWREMVDIHQHETRYERKSERECFQEVLADPSANTWYLLGEPGAGKSRLLQQWGQRTFSNEHSKLGTILPILIPFRRLGESRINTLNNSNSLEALQKELWTTAFHTASRDGWVFPSSVDQRYQPLWLFDGLDELPDTVWSAGNRFLDHLFHDLPGKKIFSCRSAVYGYRVRDLPPAKNFEILNLDHDEQKSFLRQVLPSEEANQLAYILQSRAPLSYIAGRPLILEEAARLIQASSEVSFDILKSLNNRAVFYHQIISNRWQIKVKPDMPNPLDFVMIIRECDNFLAELAYDFFESGESANFRVHIERYSELLALSSRKPQLAHEALLKSGLIRIDFNNEYVEFLHLTLQEYYLAKYWQKEKIQLPDLLAQHWTQSRYEESLALFLSLISKGQELNIEEAMDSFINHWLLTHQKNPKVLWNIGKSPLRFIFNLLGRANVNIDLSFYSKVVSASSTDFRKELACLLLVPVNLVVQMSQDPVVQVRYCIAKNLMTPKSVLAQLAQDPNEHVRGVVAYNSSSPAVVLAELAKDDSSSVREKVAYNPSAPFGVLAQLAGDFNTEVRAAVARYAPPELLMLLASDPDVNVRFEVVFNKKITSEVLALFAEEPCIDVLEWVAYNESTPAELLAMLAVGQDCSVRRMLAKNWSIPKDVLALLALDSDEEVRLLVARHKSTPFETLLELARDPCKQVRALVASGVFTPGLLHVLLGDPSEAVHLEIAKNKATPVQVLVEYATDSDENLRRCAAGNPSLPVDVLVQLARDPIWKVRQELAKSNLIPIGVLNLLARDSKDEVRRAIADNPSTSPAILSLLAKDSAPMVRYIVARNSSTPKEQLSLLAKDLDKDVRTEVAINKATPPEILSQLATDPQVEVRSWVARSEATPPKILSQLATDPQVEVRSWVARNAASLSQTLVLLANDSSREVRKNAANNNLVPMEALGQLVNDPDESVRYTAFESGNYLLEDLL